MKKESTLKVDCLHFTKANKHKRNGNSCVFKCSFRLQHWYLWGKEGWRAGTLGALLGSSGGPLPTDFDSPLRTGLLVPAAAQSRELRREGVGGWPGSLGVPTPTAWFCPSTPVQLRSSPLLSKAAGNSDIRKVTGSPGAEDEQEHPQPGAPCLESPSRHPAGGRRPPWGPTLPPASFQWDAQSRVSTAVSHLASRGGDPRGAPSLVLVSGQQACWPRLFPAKSSDWAGWAGTLAAGSCWAVGPGTWPWAWPGGAWEDPVVGEPCWAAARGHLGPPPGTSIWLL